MKLIILIPALAGRFLMFWFLPLDKEIHARNCRWTLQIFFAGGIVIRTDTWANRVEIPSLLLANCVFLYKFLIFVSQFIPL